jgi:hypothetical protein
VAPPLCPTSLAARAHFGAVTVRNVRCRRGGLLQCRGQHSEGQPQHQERSQSPLQPNRLLVLDAAADIGSMKFVFHP